MTYSHIFRRLVDIDSDVNGLEKVGVERDVFFFPSFSIPWTFLPSLSVQLEEKGPRWLPQKPLSPKQARYVVIHFFLAHLDFFLCFWFFPLSERNRMLVILSSCSIWLQPQTERFGWRAWKCWKWESSPGNRPGTRPRAGLIPISETSLTLQTSLYMRYNSWTAYKLWGKQHGKWKR